jgi:predicted TIM-barrel fold metal-dependent hydrolase
VGFSRRALNALAVILATLPGAAAEPADMPAGGCEYSDSHFHLTNYVQEGITASRFLEIMGNRVCRSTLFGIPLQQQWSWRVTRDVAPTYYLDTDAPLYYYSFTDAYIAQAYRALAPAQQARLDPMITGFNPTDMYAADHIRRVLQTFPGVFTGIGEFTIHKEFVSAKVAGDVASLHDPALDRILDFAGEVGLVVILHNDIAMPFPKEGQTRQYYDDLKAVLRRHPLTRIIWAHLGVGRIIQPLRNHGAFIEEMLNDPAFEHVYFDISWDEVAKYMVETPDTVRFSAAFLERHSDRVLFGTDTVAPATPEKYYAVIAKFAPVLDLLTPEARARILRTNYERVFDEGRRRVRAWEAANPPDSAAPPPTPASGLREAASVRPEPIPAPAAVGGTRAARHDGKSPGDSDDE